MKLSILIPSLFSRLDSFTKLKAELDRQISELDLSSEVEILTAIDAGDITIGKKRNDLLQKAKGKYICFIDDDDELSQHYLKYIFDGINNNADCCSLKGIITIDGNSGEFFEHSIKYKQYATTTNEIKYERYPNHLNCIKASIAKQFNFPEINHGEDTDWATQIYKSGMIKTEYYIPEIIYHYKYISKK